MKAFYCTSCSKRCEASYLDLYNNGMLHKGQPLDRRCRETGYITGWCLRSVEEIDRDYMIRKKIEEGKE